MKCNMKIGILITSIGNFGKQGFYNSQEMGLAKALSRYFSGVAVYKLVPLSEDAREETAEGYQNVTLRLIPAKNYGINGMLPSRILDSTLGVLLHFSDTQLSVPRAAKWCKRHGVIYLPYIGVTESHSTGKLKRIITNLMFARNLRIYRERQCLVKTPDVEKELKKHGVHKTHVAPVGLDLSLLNEDYDKTDPKALKRKYGFFEEDKVLLFVGRMTEEKRPLEMIDIFARLYRQEPTYRLLMIGSGELLGEAIKKAQEFGVDLVVKFMESIPNNEIWEAYRMADVFVNLNRQEIFGMAILEAMYYGCKTVAYHAPGPDFIIEDGVSGYLARNEEELIEAMIEKPRVSCGAHQRVAEHFMWEKTAQMVQECGKGKQNG